MDKKQEFLKRILETFRAEATENLNAMAIHLIELEKNPSKERQDELSEIIYRVAHSLKGASRSVNLTEIEGVCHAFEDVMSAIQEEEISYNPQVFDALHKTIDIITELLEYNDDNVGHEMDMKISDHVELLSMIEAGIEVENTNKSRIEKNKEKSQSEIDKKEKSLKDSTAAAAKEEEEEEEEEQKITTLEIAKKEKEENTKKSKPKTESETKIKKATSDTIRISTRKLDNVLSQAEEMLSLKLRAIQRSKDIKNTLGKFSAWHKESVAILQSANALKKVLPEEEMTNNAKSTQPKVSQISQYFEWTNSFIKDLEKELKSLSDFSTQEIYNINLKIENLLNDVKELVAVPFSTMSDIFPKMARDISKDLGKEVDFTIEGDEIKIDRRILEKIKTPLIHILRNSIDYGIEPPEVRLKKGKTSKGKVSLKIKREDNSKIGVYISDDGGGIDIEKLKRIYISKHELSDSEIKNLTKKEIINQIFQSGVSTSEIVTDLSGRGLGLAITWQDIQQIGGSIDVETEKDSFTTFKILLPQSIVTFRGIIINQSDHTFIFPTTHVEKVMRIKKSDIKTIDGKATFLLENEVVPLVKLNEILQLKEKENKADFIHVTIFENNSKKIAFVIDKVLNEQEVLVKGFSRQIKQLKFFSGASILGSGKVVPILNISDLIKASANLSSSQKSITDSAASTEQTKSILVVDDSITSRTLLKNILDSAGYQVTTAIDGIEGYTKLKEGSYSIVISDVEMPRLDGFELTSKIRADREFEDMPVVLVTSLSKKEDREKGIDVGANAYIVKSSFDQTNLIEILERLI